MRDAGCPPKRWLEELRIRGTREGLAAGVATGEVALRMGFSCRASLWRAMGRHLPEAFGRLKPGDVTGKRVEEGGGGSSKRPGRAGSAGSKTGSKGHCRL